MYVLIVELIPRLGNHDQFDMEGMEYVRLVVNYVNYFQ